MWGSEVCVCVLFLVMQRLCVGGDVAGWGVVVVCVYPSTLRSPRMVLRLLMSSLGMEKGW